jgi:hypothetical protein
MLFLQRRFAERSAYAREPSLHARLEIGILITGTGDFFRTNSPALRVVVP